MTNEPTVSKEPQATTKEWTAAAAAAANANFGPRQNVILNIPSVEGVEQLCRPIYDINIHFNVMLMEQSEEEASVEEDKDNAMPEPNNAAFSGYDSDYFGNVGATPSDEKDDLWEGFMPKEEAF